MQRIAFLLDHVNSMKLFSKNCCSVLSTGAAGGDLCNTQATPVLLTGQLESHPRNGRNKERKEVGVEKVHSHDMTLLDADWKIFSQS